MIMMLVPCHHLDTDTGNIVLLVPSCGLLQECRSNDQAAGALNLQVKMAHPPPTGKGPPLRQ